MDKYLSDKYNSNINSSEFTGWDKSRGRCESAGRDEPGDFDQQFVLFQREKQQSLRQSSTGGFIMRAEYNFENSKANPYAGCERKPVTMNLDVATVNYFKEEAARTGIPYQNIINLYLTQCAREQKHLQFS